MAAIDVLADTLISGELLAQLPDLGPCELVQGRIVHMSPAGPRHGKLEGRVYGLLDRFLEAHPLGELFVGEVGIYTKRAPDTVRGADVVFVSHERLAQNDPDASYFTVAPDIIVEVLSPGNRADEVETKVQEYLAAGSLEVWIVHPQSHTLRRHLPGRAGSELFDETATLKTPVLPGFGLPIARIFETR